MIGAPTFVCVSNVGSLAGLHYVSAKLRFHYWNAATISNVIIFSRLALPSGASNIPWNVEHMSWFFSTPTNTLSVGNVSREKQLPPVSSTWPWLASTHSQYEEESHPHKSVRLKRQVKAQFEQALLPLVSKNGPYPGLAPALPPQDKGSGLSTHIRYSPCCLLTEHPWD